jgi:arabinose-5-phosphate isomerase
MINNSIIQSGLRTIELQAASIAGLAAFIDKDFMRAAEALVACKGRLVISGIGKSAIVAQKIVATMNSTGTPSLFMHAADAIHGDLGMIQHEDIVMVISKSGDSPEIKVLAPLVKNFGNTLIGMVGNMQSYLAQQSDIILNTTVQQEACPNNLAPTTSTTAQMVMGDALAVCLMEAKGFKTDDFAKYHPGGALGKKLYLRVADLIQPHEKPNVQTGTPIKEVLVEITAKRLGAAAVLDGQQAIGIITDGDIRRMLEKYDSFTHLTAKDIMSHSPKIIASEALAAEALENMRANNISQLIAVRDGNYAGIVHLHDLVKEGFI